MSRGGPPVRLRPATPPATHSRRRSNTGGLERPGATNTRCRWARDPSMCTMSSSERSCTVSASKRIPGASTAFSSPVSSPTVSERRKRCSRRNAFPDGHGSQRTSTSTPPRRAASLAANRPPIRMPARPVPRGRFGRTIDRHGHAAQPRLEATGIGLGATRIAGSVVIEAKDGQAPLGQAVNQGTVPEVDADRFDTQGRTEDYPTSGHLIDRKVQPPNSGRSFGPNQSGVALAMRTSELLCQCPSSPEVSKIQLVRPLPTKRLLAVNVATASTGALCPVGQALTGGHPPPERLNVTASLGTPAFKLLSPTIVAG